MLLTKAMRRLKSIHVFFLTGLSFFQLHPADAANIRSDPPEETAEGTRLVSWFEGFRLTQRQGERQFLFEFVSNLSGEWWDPIPVHLEQNEPLIISESLDSQKPLTAKLVRILKEGKLVRKELQIWVHSVKRDVRVLNADDFNALVSRVLDGPKDAVK